jgi:N-acetyl-1-D-myo-inositol-2-amino-2-deoxy-alpha-D-glucopyranoside deacetylase
MNAGNEKPSLLLVHAHPDDESIFTGATMAKYAAQGARVTLVTCTMGERGFSRLAPRSAYSREQLAERRAEDLKAACAALGVNDYRFLGGRGRWSDSGIGDGDARDFRYADIDEAAGELAQVIREVSAQVIVTYDANGFYGHPDHVQAHKVAWHAYQLTCDRAQTKFYALTMPRSVLAEAFMRTSWSVDSSLPSADALQVGLPDDQVTTEIDATLYLDAKLAALSAHTTQVKVKGQLFIAPGIPRARALGIEYYALLAGPGASGQGAQASGREDNLFRGLATTSSLGLRLK